RRRPRRIRSGRSRADGCEDEENQDDERLPTAHPRDLYHAPPRPKSPPPSSPVNVRRLRKRATLLVIAALLLASAGCGGGSGSGSPAPPSAHVVLPPKRLGKTAYEQEMRRLGRELGHSLAGLFPLPAGVKGSDVAKTTVEKLKETRGSVAEVE